MNSRAHRARQPHRSNFFTPGPASAAHASARIPRALFKIVTGSRRAICASSEAVLACIDNRKRANGAQGQQAPLAHSCSLSIAVAVSRSTSSDTTTCASSRRSAVERRVLYMGGESASRTIRSGMEAARRETARCRILRRSLCLRARAMALVIGDEWVQFRPRLVA